MLNSLSQPSPDKRHISNIGKAILVAVALSLLSCPIGLVIRNMLFSAKRGAPETVCTIPGSTDLEYVDQGGKRMVGPSFAFSGGKGPMSTLTILRSNHDSHSNIDVRVESSIFSAVLPPNRMIYPAAEFTAGECVNARR